MRLSFSNERHVNVFVTDVEEISQLLLLKVCPLCTNVLLSQKKVVWAWRSGAQICILYLEMHIPLLYFCQFSCVDIVS